MSEALRTKLRNDLEQSDARLLRMINALVEEYKTPRPAQPDEVQAYRIGEERQKLLRNESQLFSARELKAKAWQCSVRYKAEPVAS